MHNINIKHTFEMGTTKSFAKFTELQLPNFWPPNILQVVATTKLLNSKVINIQVILRSVLLILTKFIQKSQIHRALLQNSQNCSCQFLASWHFASFCHNKTIECQSEIILRIVLPILKKFLQKSQIRRVLLQEAAKQSAK